MVLKFLFVYKHWSVYLHFQCLFTFSVCLFTFPMFIYIKFSKILGPGAKISVCLQTLVCLFTFSVFIYILGLFIYIFQCLFTFSVCLFTFFNVYLHSGSVYLHFQKFSRNFCEILTFTYLYLPFITYLSLSYYFFMFFNSFLNSKGLWIIGI